MGCEVRRVPANWQHPKNEKGNYIPLFDGGCYQSRVEDWDEESTKWARGEFPEYADEEIRKLTYEEWEGERPKAEDYMPCWTEAEATHFMMYEDTSEGTPISPAFVTPEELAHWLADTGASAFAGMTASYESWLDTIRRGSAISMVCTPGTGIISGVEAETLLEVRKEG